MRRAMQRFCRGERRTQHGKALAFSCILHSRRVQRHVRTVQAAFFCRTVHAAYQNILQKRSFIRRRVHAKQR